MHGCHFPVRREQHLVMNYGVRSKAIHMRVAPFSYDIKLASSRCTSHFDHEQWSVEPLALGSTRIIDSFRPCLAAADSSSSASWSAPFLALMASMRALLHVAGRSTVMTWGHQTLVICCNAAACYLADAIDIAIVCTAASNPAAQSHLVASMESEPERLDWPMAPRSPRIPPLRDSRVA